LASATALEFLVVTGDYHMATAVAAGLKQVGASFILAPNCEEGRGYEGRHRFDGIIIDLEVPSARDLILSIRQGTSNHDATVFACMSRGKAPSISLVPGANYLLHHPITAESVASHVTAARKNMTRERRRFFRHPMNQPVFLTANGVEQRAILTNLSEGGMAVRMVKPIGHPRAVEFKFELSGMPTIEGKGQVAWANNEGLIGVEFQLLRGEGRQSLKKWLGERRPLTSEEIFISANP
jgi:hypothetical protein